MNNSKRIYRAAIYVRLSKEDGDLDDVRKAESNSISNQKSLILNYLKDKEDIEIVSIREDDGYSGATFDRPAFKLMLQDVKDGIIDCIVVKDLSRFAREYIDAGRYIERMPSLTRNVVVSLIQSVKVYEGGDIEIVLDCDDEYRKIVARAGELERQHDAERLVV